MLFRRVARERRLRVEFRVDPSMAPVQWRKIAEELRYVFDMKKNIESGERRVWPRDHS